MISPDTIMRVYQRSVSMGLKPKDMLTGESMLSVTAMDGT